MAVGNTVGLQPLSPELSSVEPFGGSEVVSVTFYDPRKAVFKFLRAEEGDAGAVTVIARIVCVIYVLASPGGMS